MKPVQIAKGVYDVGVIDWTIRDFHGYSTHMGTSYNAFLVLGEKTVLIDTVKKNFADQFLRNIAGIVDPSEIDVVISNHTEMDHSGSLPHVMNLIGRDKPIYCSNMGKKNLSRHFVDAFNLQEIREGEDLVLGDKTYSFIETRMLHWPDSMFTYLKEDKILFSSDAFGQHYAGHEQFDDRVGEKIMFHAKKYFANILLLYAPLILKLIDKVIKMGLDIRMICPDHGVMWRKPSSIIDAYTRWSRQEELDDKAVVVYDTMWHSTEQMGLSIADGLHAEGIDVRPMKLREHDRSDIMTEVCDARAIVVGSPTLNNGIFPTVADFLTYMKGLKPQNRIGAAFGSFGWSGESVKILEKELAGMKFNMVAPGLKHQYVPDNDAIERCVAFGRQIAAAVKASGNHS
ncbi:MULTISPECIES: FprA family A-type flavoprotein [Desulfococcus]|uniref:Beta-lactamase domain protein n=1 Tax=Desulfococcus multivorans DSM 2059 TaxID=1121405 RepID=S7TQN7_DESML|nr:flavodoxin domain-containing protein [Desulfococcus multivorans]AOY57899.1 Roo1: rubredoxin-oxygen oxidoreductase [Desulfococcus multivorans]AQV00274.1 FprA family A-type flavoprotein [Desulfococcus multivorans]EPR38980.1 beta-lactamase domain protein [Desulfococcus multivorans DSM 2059]SJZ65791.1 Flavorubredoxin [Desulfococcus multivorans DSM 2059]